ncbi:MAG: guanylate kinase [Clostridia bacterium]|nr:guanylate kinase [Clostridia bacterium]
MMAQRRGLLVVFSGPSGSGKGTVLKAAMEKDKNLTLSVSVTTRSPREGELDGVNYYFFTREEFIKKRDEGGFLEWAEFCGNCYGTPRDKVEEQLLAGKDVILEIEVQGALKVREAFPDAVLIFNMPPSMEELKNRLVGRNTESLQVVEERLKTAVWELSNAHAYDYVIVNHEIAQAAEDLICVIAGEKCKTMRNKALLEAFR